MSIQSDKVKKWRRNCKEKIVQAMGGACCICGYNRSNNALALHHLDPSKKDFGLGAIRANPTKWIKIVEELRKCILVCNNCHSEIHEGLTEVPSNAPRFNEEFANYEKVEKESEKYLTPCPVCGTLKSLSLKYCSRECSAKSKYKVDWDQIDLVKELKNKSIVQLAEDLGCSDAAIHKRLKRLSTARVYEPARDNIITKCDYCGDKVIRFGSQVHDNYFCSRDHKILYFRELGWPTDEELIEMRKTMKIKEISQKIDKAQSAVYDRFSKIRANNKI